MILTYHEINEADSGYTYAVSRSRFEDHVQQLAGLRALGRGFTDKLVITFDDGHVSHYRFGLPLLEKHGLRNAIFFVTAGWIEQQPGCLSWPQLKEITRAGYEVQSHSWSHQFLTKCSDAELREEVRRSKDTLEERLGREVDAISTPGGTWDVRVVKACAEAGYKRMYTSDPWFGERELGGIRVIGRFSVRRTITAESLRLVLEAEDKSLSLPRLSYQFRRAVRKVLGVQLYHKLWCVATRYSKQDALNRLEG
jgi:peptidoglycan/xylan/chitin deacetylase (PgdA/CDA1 family)